jgi:hypothetical protein
MDLGARLSRSGEIESIEIQVKSPELFAHISLYDPEELPSGIAEFLAPDRRT